MCSVPLKARVLTLNKVLSLSAALLALSSVLVTFLNWDKSGRNSYELLSVIERNGLLPGSVPISSLLVWWVLQPVIALALIYVDTSVMRGAPINRVLSVCLGLAHYLTVIAVSVAATFVPGSTLWPLTTVALCVVGLVLCVAKNLVSNVR